MTIKYYSIHDKDANEYGPMFPAKNDLIALRVYRKLLKEVPEDVKPSYTLHCLGELDDESGQLSFPFEPYEVPTNILEVDK